MKRIAGAVIATFWMSSVALAGVEVGGTAGLHVFSEDNGLGVQKSPMATSEKNSALFGLRLGVYFGNMFGVEAEAGMIPSESRTLVFDIYNLAYRASVVAQFRAADPTNTVVPFVLAGAGALEVIKTNDPLTIAKDRVFVPHVGAGVKYRAGNGFGLRGDLRLMLPPSSEPGSSYAIDFEALLSLYKDFGAPQKPELKEPPKGDDDPDKDGIAGAADKCPTEPEDKDGFEDDNGCPDPDNDADGILDGADKCPTEAEDKDGFEDEDGCPDPDNDGDGVPDAADKCPDKQETKNGFEDDDGCPDEIPEKLKQFTGVIQGINFKVSSAELAPNSSKALDKAVAVLGEYKEIKLEIAGHTDDQPIGKTSAFPDNQALSQARAESVKAYFVSKGIEDARLTAKGYGDSQPVEDPKGLTGGKLNAARAKNRRVEFKLVSALDAPEKASEKAPEKAPEKTPEKTDKAPEKTPEKTEKAPEKAPAKTP